jgi:hypothetical protein
VQGTAITHIFHSDNDFTMKSQSYLVRLGITTTKGLLVQKKKTLLFVIQDQVYISYPYPGLFLNPFSAISHFKGCKLFFTPSGNDKGDMLTKKTSKVGKKKEKRERKEQHDLITFLSNMPWYAM